MTSPTSLIINSAFTEPQQHWAENPDRTLRREPVRRPAGYEIIDTVEVDVGPSKVEIDFSGYVLSLMLGTAF